jgi:hypothetical protein
MTVRMKRREITRADILPLQAYEAVRAQKRTEMRTAKRTRQLGVGPHAMFTFESYESMWLQVHEMLRIEKGGDAQIDDELAAYNPMIPNGRELTATMLIEIESPVLRAQELVRLGGIEETIRLRIRADGQEHLVPAVPERDTERTDAETGKTSSVHFVHFPFSDAQVAAFRAANAEVTLEITHSRYKHAAGMADEMRASLATDFDGSTLH